MPGREVVVLREVGRVRDLVAVLKRTDHNGFPIVHVGRHQRCTFFAGRILRRQLLVLLQERVWEHQHADRDIPDTVVERFVGSFTNFADADLVGHDSGEGARVGRGDGGSAGCSVTRPMVQRPRCSATTTAVTHRTDHCCEAAAIGCPFVQLPLPPPLLSAVRCPLSAVRCPLSAVRCPVPAVRCPLSAVRCPLSAAA